MSQFNNIPLKNIGLYLPLVLLTWAIIETNVASD